MVRTLTTAKTCKAMKLYVDGGHTKGGPPLSNNSHWCPPCLKHAGTLENKKSRPWPWPRSLVLDDDDESVVSAGNVCASGARLQAVWLNHAPQPG